MEQNKENEERTQKSDTTNKVFITILAILIMIGIGFIIFLGLGAAVFLIPLLGGAFISRR